MTLPTRLEIDHSWHDVSIGQSHACAIADDRSLWCWDRNARGQLGDAEAWFYEPVEVDAPEP